LITLRPLKSPIVSKNLFKKETYFKGAALPYPLGSVYPYPRWQKKILFMDPLEKRLQTPKSQIKKSIRLLLIEDDQEDVFLLTKSLALLEKESVSFHLETRPTLKAALDHLIEKRFDLALLDLNLPDSRGMGTFKMFAEKAGGLPVIILSGTDDAGVALDAVRSGAEDYLVKSKILDAQLLARSILYAIERHRIKHELANVTEELKNANTQLEQVALIDPLTGLLNRRGLQHVLSLRQSDLLRQQAEHVAILMDLDNFKMINDALGHVAGDIVLKEVSQKLKECLRTGDYIARLGGDEFLILLPHTRPSHGILVAEKIRLAISDATIVFSSGPVKITASFGIGTVSPDISSPDELLSKTQFVLRESKVTGKNRVSCEKKMNKYRDASKDILSRIINHLQAGDLIRTVKQPLYNLPAQKITGYEFLTRLTLGDFQMADEFFQLCMESNILTLVDHHCFRGCVNASTFTPGFECHINLFPSTILAVTAEQLIRDIPVNRNGTKYCIELSEKQIIGNPSYLIPAVQAFKKAGILVGIDDIGYGNSCLENLILLEPDFVKIDRKCIIDIEKRPDVLKNYQRFLTVANSLKIKVIAEGIEKKEELQILLDLGVQFGQGYLLGRPE
jgi:diguanylate cyclase (GGDEF)-like protein